VRRERSASGGKTLKVVALFVSPEVRAVTLRFADDTDLTLEIKTWLGGGSCLCRLENRESTRAEALAGGAERSGRETWYTRKEMLARREGM
jgi:hypothetical protein